jgi:hypothetical protein
MRLTLQPTQNRGFPSSSGTPVFARTAAFATKTDIKQNPNQKFPKPTEIVGSAGGWLTLVSAACRAHDASIRMSPGLLARDAKHLKLRIFQLNIGKTVRPGPDGGGGHFAVAQQDREMFSAACRIDIRRSMFRLR